MLSALLLILSTTPVLAGPQTSPGDPRPPVSPVREKVLYDGPAATGHGPVIPLRTETIASGFEAPVDAVFPPGDDGRMFVVERRGKVWVVAPDGAVLEDPYLDLSPVVTFEGSEQGLVSMTFHPLFEANGLFYVFFTNLEGHVEILEFRQSRVDRNRAERLARKRVLFLEQPHQYHNGGTIRFDPDGYMFVSLGDGGGIGDQFGNGQNRSTLQGSIIRIDVDAGSPYAVPADNPFIGEGASEVWAYGLRNPWRIFIDPVDRVMVVGDVGQGRVEEIDLLSLDTSGGSNFGWSVMEGDECYEGFSGACDPGAFDPPVLAYPHSQGCAVLAGPVYRGSALPGLRGWVTYADFCFGWVRAFPLSDPGGEVIELVAQDTFSNIYSLAVDPMGEILVLTLEGDIVRLIHG